MIIQVNSIKNTKRLRKVLFNDQDSRFISWHMEHHIKESDIEPYYTDIRHGKRPTDEELQDLKDRYEFIGGLSPLVVTLTSSS